jgi:hypothetical protein
MQFTVKVRPSLTGWESRRMNRDEGREERRTARNAGTARKAVDPARVVAPKETVTTSTDDVVGGRERDRDPYREDGGEG